MKNKKNKLMAALLMAAMFLSVMTGCSDNAISELEESGVTGLNANTRTVAGESLEVDSISSAKLASANVPSDEELKKRIRGGWWKQYSYTLSNGETIPEQWLRTDYTQVIYPEAPVLFFIGMCVDDYVDIEFVAPGTTPIYCKEVGMDLYEFKTGYNIPIFFQFRSKATGNVIDTIIFFIVDVKF